MSARTKKRLWIVAIVTGVLLLALAATLIVVSVLNDRPPEFSSVRERFEGLIERSQELNNIIWGEGLPTYRRVERNMKTFKIEFEAVLEKEVENEDGDLVLVKETKLVKEALGYYLFEDDTYGTVVSYEYQVRVWMGETTDVKLPSGEMQTVNVYTVYDAETGGVLNEYKQGASRFARRTKTPIEGETVLYRSENYYYYALPNYENPDIAYDSIVYTGREDQNYDYVRFDAAYKSTDELRDALAAVYANDYMAPLYENLFTGAFGGMNDVYQPVYTDYTDEENDATYLMKANDKTIWKWQELRRLTFDYSTMQMLDDESDARTVKVSVQYREQGKEGVQTMIVSFALENGNWYLNSATY